MIGFSGQPNPQFFGAETGAVKIWTGSAVVTGGIATFDWTSAGFVSAPVPMVTAASPNTTTVTDRVWATMRTDWTSTGGSAYGLRGANIALGGDTVRTCLDGTVIYCTAIGN